MQLQQAHSAGVKIPPCDSPTGDAGANMAIAGEKEVELLQAVVTKTEHTETTSLPEAEWQRC